MHRCYNGHWVTVNSDGGDGILYFAAIWFGLWLFCKLIGYIDDWLEYKYFEPARKAQREAYLASFIEVEPFLFVAPEGLDSYYKELEMMKKK
jgi:hypothetical protein